MLPKIRRCPCCNTISLIKVNGVSYQNGFESLSEWNLKKIFNCRKCNVQLGLFSDKLEQKDKLIWLDFLKCEDSYHNKLNKLYKVKEKNKNNDKKLNDTLQEIEKIQNEINLAKIKLKIKFKLQHKGTLLRHVS
tara:strand:+ start:1901 stop:2302 length:402 start_codon:yes stop_codon:yes gene_type:complete